MKALIKATYQELKLEILTLDIQDVITASTDGEDNLGSWDWGE